MAKKKAKKPATRKKATKKAKAVGVETTKVTKRRTPTIERRRKATRKVVLEAPLNVEVQSVVAEPEVVPGIPVVEKVEDPSGPANRPGQRAGEEFDKSRRLANEALRTAGERARTEALAEDIEKRDEGEERVEAEKQVAAEKKRVEGA